MKLKSLLALIDMDETIFIRNEYDDYHYHGANRDADNELGDDIINNAKVLRISTGWDRAIWIVTVIPSEEV